MTSGRQPAVLPGPLLVFGSSPLGAPSISISWFPRGPAGTPVVGTRQTLTSGGGRATLGGETGRWWRRRVSLAAAPLQCHRAARGRLGGHQAGRGAPQPVRRARQAENATIS